MNLLIAQSKEQADVLNAKAQAYLEQTVAGYNAGQWSAVYTDGSLYGIAWEDKIRGAFTDDELLAVSSVDGDGVEHTILANVIDTEQADKPWAAWTDPTPTPATP